MIRVLPAAAIVAALSFSAVYATAEEVADRGTKEDQAACTPDVFRLCSAYIPDEKQIVICLKKNMPRLSRACRRVMS